MKRFLIVLPLASALLMVSQAATALAEPVWLVEGAAVPSAGMPITGFATLEFIDLKTFIGEIAVSCHFDIDGLVKPLGRDEHLQILTFTTKELVEELKGPGVECTSKKGCETTVKDVELWGEHLPVLTRLENVILGGGLEMTLDRYFREEALEPGYTILCLILGATVEDTCLGVVSADLENEIGGVSAEFNKAEQEAEAEQQKCSQSGEKSGQISGEIIYTADENLPLAFDK